MPQLLLLNALLVFLEVLHQVFNFLDLSFGIRVNDLREIFHKTEICSHGISKARQLAELGNERDLSSSASVLVDQKRLILIIDVFIVASLVILLVAHLSSILIESGCWTLGEVNPVDLVRLLVVPRDDSRTGQSLLDRLLTVLSALLSFVSDIVHMGEERVSSDDLEGNVDVQKDALLFHY